MRIEKSELKYLGLSYIFIVLLGLVSGISSINTKISSLNPLWQFLILNLGLYLIFFFLIKGLSLGTGKKRFFVGALGSIMAFMSMDMLLPEYHVSITGELIKGGVFGQSATDYFFGYVWGNLGVHGLLLWIMTYVVTFTIVFFIGAFLVDNFIKNQIG